MCAHTCNSKGFTLLEMIAVIVVLAILAVLASKFVAESTRSYQSTQERYKLINTGRQAVESMSRLLRSSLSYSVRITNTNNCLEFMPIAGGGYYLNSVPDAANGMPAASTIDVADHTIDFGSAQYVTIGAASAAEVYGVAPVSRATLSARTNVLLTLSATKSWARNSLGQHFFLVDAPQAFCVIGGQLRLYSNQDATSTTLASAVNTAAAYTLLANNVTSTTPFSLSVGSENRNIVVTFDVTFANSVSGESVTLNQSVMVRNVP